MLFMAGSVLFALGSFPAYWALVDSRAVGVTFVVGAVLFTSAASGQLVQELRGGDALLRWAAGVQLVGTLLFNVNTVLAMVDTFTIRQENRLVWAPDFFGSIAFLVASHLVWLAVGGRLWSLLPERPDWWSALLNYVGSVFFMAAALAAFTLNTTGEVVNITVVNAGTFAGAVCFFVGSYLLLPAVTEHARPA